MKETRYMMSKFITIIFTLPLFITSITFPQIIDTEQLFTKEEHSDTIKASTDIELEGFIVDDTHSKLGHDFYDLFYLNYSPPEDLRKHTIIISELPVPGSGTRITISVEDQQIFQQFIQPRNDQVEELADYAVQLTQSYLMNYEQIQKQLMGEDLQGTGIY